MMGLKFVSHMIMSMHNGRNHSTTAVKCVDKKLGKLKKAKNHHKKTRSERIKWTEEQKGILEKAKLGFSTFVTGPAGTGKTVLLKELIKAVKKLRHVAVTASTGVAACALRGQTLHSFAGVGQALAGRESLLQRVLGNENAVERWTATDTLVIDEISMVDATLFDDLEHIARTVRGFDKPWGGLQLIVCGDFLQLPPVIGQRRLYRKDFSVEEGPPEKEFAFEAECWDSSFQIQVELTKVFRQSDSRLVKLLQGIRRGEIDDEDLMYLEHSCSGSEPDPSVVRLFPRIEDVEKVNKERMQELGKEIVVYEAKDQGRYDYRWAWRRLLKHCQAPERLELCQGARVMLIKNLNPRAKLVNGATGVLTSFKKVGPDDEELLPVVKFDFGKEMEIEKEKWDVMEGDKVIAWRTQIPLIPAWALSIHKCQGISLDKLHTDLSKAFGCGMVYVALSRVTSLKGLHLSGFSPAKIRANPKVLEFYQSFCRKQGRKDEDKDDDRRQEPVAD